MPIWAMAVFDRSQPVMGLQSTSSRRRDSGVGKYIIAEFFSGIYKEAGKHVYEAAIGASVGIYTINPEIVSFFLSHADQLKLYFTYVYEQYPAVKIIFNFLEAHIGEAEKPK